MPANGAIDARNFVRASRKILSMIRNNSLDQVHILLIKNAIDEMI